MRGFLPHFARISVSTVCRNRRGAQSLNLVWTLDFAFDRSGYTQLSQAPAMIGEFIEIILAIKVKQSVTSDHLIRTPKGLSMGWGVSLGCLTHEWRTSNGISRTPTDAALLQRSLCAPCPEYPGIRVLVLSFIGKLYFLGRRGCLDPADS